MSHGVVRNIYDPPPFTHALGGLHGDSQPSYGDRTFAAKCGGAVLNIALFPGHYTLFSITYVWVKGLAKLYPAPVSKPTLEGS